MEEQTPPQENQLVSLFNPDFEDFTTTYDINEDTQPVTFVLPSHEIAEFPKAVAQNIERGLADRIVRKNGVQGSNYEIEFNKALERIRV